MVIEEMLFQTSSLHEKKFRYERKFLAEGISVEQVHSIIKLHPAMFVMAYPARFVNNLYLDTEEMGNYFDNVDGVENRQKVRIRWYGDLFGEILKPVLELKVKRGLVGTKFQYPFTPFQLGRGFSRNHYRAAMAQTQLPSLLTGAMRMLNIVLLNRYYRWYYATKDGRFRITLDTQMQFHHVAQLNNHFVHQQSEHNYFVVELKYQLQDEREAQRVSSSLPFRVSKSSKYIQGIERVFA